MRIWPKNQRRFNFFEKNFKFIKRNSMENWFLIDFLSDLPGPLSFYTLENNTIFLQQFLLFRGNISPPLPRGWPCLISPRNFIFWGSKSTPFILFPRFLKIKELEDISNVRFFLLITHLARQFWKVSSYWFSLFLIIHHCPYNAIQ